MNLWKCGCGALNESSDVNCEACGVKGPGAPTQLPASTRMTCPVDGAAMVRGICTRGGGAPMTDRCPFACPICRKPLEWCGTCYSCHGAVTGSRADWTFPGDRYELEDGHWIKVLDGPRRACTPAENQAGARELLRVLAGAPMLRKRPGVEAPGVIFTGALAASKGPRPITRTTEVI